MNRSATDHSSPIPAAAFQRALLSRQHAATEALQRVLKSGQLILGPEVALFESEFAAFVNISHAVGVASGTDALILALRALGIGDGDEVICIANGPVPTVSAIRAVGGVPKFVDINRHTMQVDVSLIEKSLSAQTRCVVAVHLYGCPVDLNPLLALTTDRNIALIEDCAQAHGTRYADQHVGTFGVIGCFSFYPTKNLSAFGDAGACVTNDPELDQRLRELRMYGFRDRAVAEQDGLNSRLDEVQAAILRSELLLLNEKLARRNRHAAAYLQGLDPQYVRLPEVTKFGSASWHQFVIRTIHRDAVQQQLQSEEIFCGIHYAWPVHLMPAYRDLGYALGALPVTEQACAEVLSLPMIPELSDGEVSRVIDAVNRAAAAIEADQR